MADDPRILVIRTSPELDLEPLLDTASRLFQNSTIDVLKGDEESHLESEKKFVQDYVYYEGFAWSKKALTGKLQSTLKQRGYDILFLGVGSEWRDRALGLKLFAWRTGIGSVILMDEHGEAKAYNRGSWLLRSLYVETVWRVGYKILVEKDERLALAELKLVPWRRKLKRKTRTGKKRIAVVTYSLGVGGVQKQILELARGLDRSQYELQVYLLVKEEAFFEPALRELNIPVFYLYETPQRMLLYRKMASELAKALASFDPHVIHSYMNYPSVVACLAAGLTRPDVLMTSIRTLTGKGAGFYTWQGETCRELDRAMVQASDVVVGNSQAVLSDYSQWTGLSDEKMQVVYNGIDPQAFDSVGPEEVKELRESMELSPNKPLVLTVGRLSAEKGQVTFCRAMERLVQTNPDVRGVLVGEGNTKSLLRTQFKSLEDAGALEFAGNRSDVPTWMRAADVVVLTSEIEGLPNVLIEAAWAETPVVTTACGGGEEVVEDGVTGFVVPVGDDEAVAARVRELLADPAKAKAMGAAARLRAQAMFSPDKMVSDTVAHYCGVN